MTLESQIVTAVCHLLQIHQNMDELYWIRNNSGAVINQQGRFIRMGRRGSSDIIVWFKHACEFWEIKTPKGRQSAYQKEFAELIGKLGYQYRIIRSVDEAEQAIINAKKMYTK